MEPIERQKGLKLLLNHRNIEISRNLESAIHSRSQTSNEYYDNIKRVSWNLYNNPSLEGVEMVFQLDKDLIHGTLLERIVNETKARAERFERMLQEKYDMINEKKYTSLIKCRRCGSEEVSYDEKQTRSADEAATIFCLCSTCGQRWIMR
jgi:DNA-directed RNA polymerase subunit M/transcription elongation factor TFIIS